MVLVGIYLTIDISKKKKKKSSSSSSLALITDHGALSRELPTNATGNATTTTTSAVDAWLHRVMNSTSRTMNGTNDSVEESHGRNHSSRPKKSSSVQAPVTGTAVQAPTAGPGPVAAAPAIEPVAAPAPATGAAVQAPTAGPGSGPAAPATSTGPAAAPAPVTDPAAAVPGVGPGPSGRPVDPSNQSNLVIDRSSTPLGSGNLVVDHQHRPGQGGSEHVFTNDGSKAFHYQHDHQTCRSILLYLFSSSQSIIMISTIVILLLTGS